MRLTPFAISVALASTVSTAFALVSGRVIDRSGAALPGVSVRQVLSGDVDTTDAQGAWSIGTISVGASRETASAGAGVLLRGNVLRVVLEQPSTIVVEGLSVDGRRVPLLDVIGQVGPNDLLLDPSAVRPGGLLRIRTDRGTTVVSTLAKMGSDRSASGEAYRAAAVPDTLVFEKFGYERVVHPMPAGQDTFLVAMDSVLEVPQALVNAVVSTSANTISWLPVTGATGYEVRRCSSTRTSCSDTGVTHPGYVQDGLSAGSTLRIRVRTTKGERSSAWSDELLVHRLPSAPLSRGKVLDTLPAFEMPGNLTVSLPGWRKLARVRAYTEATPFQDTTLAPDTTIVLRAGSGALPVFDTAWIRVVVYDSLGDSASCRIRVTERTLSVVLPKDTTVPFGVSSIALRLQAISKVGIKSVTIGGWTASGSGGNYMGYVPLYNGMNALVVAVTDLGGGSFQGVIRVTVLPDTAHPKIVRTTVPASPMAWTKTAFVNFSVTDNDSLRSVTINGFEQSLPFYAYRADITLEPGENHVVIVATDRSGNATKDSISIVTFLKDRDGNAIRFGRMPDGKMWTLQNLQVNPSASSIKTGTVSTCANDSCPKYGRLYTWSMTMDVPAACDTVSCVQSDSLSHQGLCPTAWHVPTLKEWKSLITASAAGASDSIGLSRLRSTSADGKWYSWVRSTCDPVSYTEYLFSGTDKYGFNMLPTEAAGGSGVCGGTGYTRTALWTATQSNATTSTALYFASSFEAGQMPKNSEMVLRCIAD